eukprot:INCI3456.1.p1 GENE.INCI3456.1~~INCI3456.1.p1  ORF type:complete len:467 (+),score=48.63 INCI3456.1:341-1741(+)
MTTAAQAYYLPPAQSSRAVGGLGPHVQSSSFPPPPALTGAPLAAAPYMSRFSYDPSLYTNTASSAPSAPTPDQFASLGPVSGTGMSTGNTIGKIISLLHVLQAQLGGNPLVGTLPSFLEVAQGNAATTAVGLSQSAADSGPALATGDQEGSGEVGAHPVSFLESGETSPTVVQWHAMNVIGPAQPSNCCCCAGVSTCCGLRPAQNDMNVFGPFPFDSPSPVQPITPRAPVAMVLPSRSAQQPVAWPAQNYPIQQSAAADPGPVVAVVPLPTRQAMFPWGAPPPSFGRPTFSTGTLQAEPGMWPAAQPLRYGDVMSFQNHAATQRALALLALSARPQSWPLSGNLLVSQAGQGPSLVQQREHAQQIENIVRQLQQMQMQYTNEPMTPWGGTAVNTPATFFSDDAKETVDEVSQATSEAKAGVARKVHLAMQRVNQVLAHLGQDEIETRQNGRGQRSLRGSKLSALRE